uniref:T9SS type A sorting domain-containing protein n=1 Tax=Roseihalotalea indica TaxID=2867963 RepID=A0AA49GUG8_9BACT|nr:hypothetical protein K4G66_13340 [Tunicatimonas sp. TK19036]
MRKIYRLALLLALILLVSLSYQSYAQTPANAQDSLVLLAFHQDVQQHHWPQLWDTQQSVSSWEGVILNDQGKVTSLTFDYDLLGMKVDSLPSSIGILKDLDMLGRLSVIMLEIKYISPKLGDLSQLGALSLDYNDIVSLPEEIGNLKKVIWLTITYNELTSLPEGIGGMEKLSTFYVSNNHLTSLPNGLSRLPYLNYINFSYNDLEAFPEALVDIESLSEITGTHNKMKGGIPAALWERGERQLVPDPLSLNVSYNELSGRVLDESTDESLVGLLNISYNHYRLQDIYPDYEQLQLYWCNLTFMPQRRIGSHLQTVTPDENGLLNIQIEGYTPLEGSNVQWFSYSSMSDRGRFEFPAGSTYPLIKRTGQGFYYCKITHPDLPDYEIVSNPLRVIINNKRPVISNTDIRFRQGETPPLWLGASDDFSYSELLTWTIPEETPHLKVSFSSIVPKDPAWTGTDTLHVRVEDEHGGVTKEDVLITVLPLQNTAPVVNLSTVYMSLAAESPCEAGDPDCEKLFLWNTALQLAPFVHDDLDDLDDLQLSIVEFDGVGTPSSYFHAGVDLNSGIFLNSYIIAHQDTSAIITLRVVDSEGEVTEQQIELIAKIDNQPFQLADIPEQKIAVGETFPPLDLKQYASDDYTPVENLVWKAYPQGDVRVKLDQGIATVTPFNPDQPQSFTVIYEAYETDLFSYKLVEVTYTITEKEDEEPEPENVFISGTIITGDQQPLTEVQLTGLPETIVTDAQGVFTVEVSADWSGTITPVKEDYTFSPASLEVSKLEGDLADQNFTATYTGNYTISGNILDDQGKPLADVSLQGAPATVVTDADGRYVISVPAGWKGSITAKKEQYTFSPESLDFTDVQENMSNQQFLASLVTEPESEPEPEPEQEPEPEVEVFYTIAGVITDQHNNPLPQVTLTGDTITIVTDAQGHYTITVPTHWSGTLTPTMPDYTFSPVNLEFEDVQEDAGTQNFTATYTGTYLVSGIVLDSSNEALAAITINIDGLDQLANIQTDEEGRFSLEVPADWSGTLTPADEEYSFEPEKLVFSNLRTNQSEQNFTAQTTTVVEEPKTPSALGIVVYPNPTDGEATIELDEALAQEASLLIMNTEGRIVWQAIVPTGSKRIQWPGTNQAGGAVSVGIYQLRLMEANKPVRSVKISVIK